jgi:hypothetical protein
VTEGFQSTGGGNGGTTRDVPWTGTGGPEDINSYSWLLLNAIYNRLSTSTLFAGFAVKRITRALPFEAAYQLPALGVYIGKETAVSDGEFNASNIRFNHTVPIGIQIIVKDNDSVAMQQTLDKYKWFAINQLFRDNTLTNFYKPSLTGPSPSKNFHVEGIPRLSIPSPEWGRDSKSETPLGMQVIEVIYQFGTSFNPTDFDDLKEIAVKAYPELAPPATTATGTGTGSGTNLTMTAVAGTIELNATVSGNGVPVGTTITAQQSGTIGGNGIYTTSLATTSVAQSLTFENPVAIMEVDTVYRFDPDYVPPPLTGAGP